MSISCCVFDFAPDSLIRCFVQSSTFVIDDGDGNKKNCYTLKFPLQTDCFNGGTQCLLDKVWSNEPFTLEIYDENMRGKKITGGRLESLEYDIKAGDCVDVKMVFSGLDHDSKLDYIKPELLRPARVYTGSDCNVSIVDDCGDRMGGECMTSFFAQAKRDNPNIFGKFIVLNSFLKERPSLNPIQIVKRCKGGSTLDLGLINRQKDMNWLVRLVDINCEIVRRSVKDGLDIVEIAFQGKRS